MKNPTQKNKAARASTPAPAPSPATPTPAPAPPLTVTLDPQAAEVVRQFAAERRLDCADVASGSILDNLPQALDEWLETKAARAAGKRSNTDYWQALVLWCCEAQERRLASTATDLTSAFLKLGPEALTLTIRLDGFHAGSFRAMCADDGVTVEGGIQYLIQSNIQCWIDARFLKQEDADKFWAANVGGCSVAIAMT